VPSWKWMERVSRKICVELGSIASTCKAPRTGREVKDWGIHFTVTKAIGIGRRVRAAQRHHEDPVEAILDEAPGDAAFSVIDVARGTTTDGCLLGRTVIAGPPILESGTSPPVMLPLCEAIAAGLSSCDREGVWRPSGSRG
jgi:uncharacterized protein